MEEVESQSWEYDGIHGLPEDPRRRRLVHLPIEERFEPPTTSDEEFQEGHPSRRREAGDESARNRGDVHHLTRSQCLLEPVASSSSQELSLSIIFTMPVKFVRGPARLPWSRGRSS